jgi:enamine deaminase RidA (YjgF/YER057c/UK114 family)
VFTNEDYLAELLVEGGIIFQTSQVFDNIKNILEAAGSDATAVA